MLSLLPTAFYAAGFLALLLLFYQVVKNFGEGRQRRRARNRLKKPRPNVKHIAGG